jgi:CDP-ribitol ribitolphosphotransferase
MLADALGAAGIKTEMYLQRQEKDEARFMGSAAGNLRMILRQMGALASARVAVTDGYSIPVSILKHRKGLTVIQMWHAVGAVKKFGLQTLPVMSDAERSRASNLKMHRGYDLFAAPSERTAQFFAEAFGMDAGKALVTGTPYLDALYNGRFDRREEIKGAYPVLAENGAAGGGCPRQVVLYVPTYRHGADARGEDGTGGTDGRLAEAISELRAALDAGRYILVVKSHPIEDVDPVAAPAGSGLHGDGDVVFADGFSAEELMYAADIVVTDYSSLAFTAGLMGKPLFFFVYDIDVYRGNPGINIDPEEEYGRYTARNAAELARMIDGSAGNGSYDFAFERYFAGKYVETYDGGCTARLAAEIVKHI